MRNMAAWKLCRVTKRKDEWHVATDPCRVTNKSVLLSGSSCQDVSENAIAGIKSLGKAVGHVETFALATCRL